MKNRLILVEGMPGSGKSTISRKIKDYLESNGLDVVLYNEGDIHPADMAWNALLTKEEYNNIINLNKEYENIINQNSIYEDEYVLVAYTKLGLPEDKKELIKRFESHEIYDGRVPCDLFKELHLKRWKKFSEKMKDDKNKTIIFECAFLQNHVNELLAVHEKDLNYIKEYLKELIETVRALNPKLIYLNQLSVEETLNKVAKERVSDNKEANDDWINIIIEYFENSNYGKHNNLNGFDGLVRYFEKRQEIELKIIENLSIDNLIVNNHNYDWKDISHNILKNINYIISKYIRNGL